MVPAWEAESCCQPAFGSVIAAKLPWKGNCCQTAVAGNHALTETCTCPTSAELTENAIPSTTQVWRLQIQSWALRFAVSGFSGSRSVLLPNRGQLLQIQSWALRFAVSGFSGSVVLPNGGQVLQLCRDVRARGELELAAATADPQLLVRMPCFFRFFVALCRDVGSLSLSSLLPLRIHSCWCTLVSSLFFTCLPSASCLRAASHALQAAATAGDSDGSVTALATGISS